MNIPVNYDLMNVYNSERSPSTVHVDSGLSAFFRRYLLQKALSVFKWKMPESWAENYFLYILYLWGYIAIVNTDKFGVIPQQCGLMGYNVFYQPTNAVISNPLLRGIIQPRIGKDCTLIRLQPDYGGISDLVAFYGDMMALCAQTAGVNLVNSKLSYVFAASNKASAESFKKLYDQIASGDPCAVIDKALMNTDGTPTWNMFTQNVKENYIAGDVMQDMRKWEQQFDTEIGIPNANTDKRERLITDEVNANNVETFSKCSMWLDNLQKTCKEANSMFGIDLSVDWRYGPNIGGDADGRNNVSDGALSV